MDLVVVVGPAAGCQKVGGPSVLGFAEHHQSFD